MENKFSDNIQQLLERSRREALRHNNREITPAHLLLAMLSDLSSPTVKLMEQLADGVSVYELRQQLDDYLFNNGKSEGASDLSVTDLTNRVIKLSLLEGRLLKASVIDTEHVMLALFRNYEVQNMEFIKPFLEAGIDYDRLYAGLAVRGQAQLSPMMTTKRPTGHLLPGRAVAHRAMPRPPALKPLTARRDAAATNRRALLFSISSATT